MEAGGWGVSGLPCGWSFRPSSTRVQHLRTLGAHALQNSQHGRAQLLRVHLHMHYALARHQRSCYACPRGRGARRACLLGHVAQIKMCQRHALTQQPRQLLRPVSLDGIEADVQMSQPAALSQRPRKCPSSALTSTHLIIAQIKMS
eukprot:2509317-Rhodomonas_salina.2